MNKANDPNYPNYPDDSHRDPLTGAPGAHPVGTGVGAAGGAATGAAIGAAIGGPVGAAIGLAAGAVAGGLAGKGAAEAINPTMEDAYWRENYAKQPWVEKNRTFDEYHPAFRTGYTGYSRYGAVGKSYDEVEPDLRSDYEKSKGKTALGWEKAKSATRAAWDRLESTSKRGLDNAKRETTSYPNRDANRDPISGSPGAHPVGTGVGAAGGGVAGAAVGTAVGGPVGAAVGLAAGAVVGGLAGKGTAEAVNPTVEDEYWRSNYNTQQWYETRYTYPDYSPAFRTGYEGYSKYGRTGKTYAEVERDLERDYERLKGGSALTWDRAKSATRAAWDRVSGRRI